MGNWSQTRLRNLSETDRRRDNSRVQSGFGKKIENSVGRELAYPDNVLHLATECANQGHSATFPVDLPAWFIKLFTQPGDLVLDPFIGSGTTALAAKQLNRRCIGIEINEEYVQIARARLKGIHIQTLSLQAGDQESDTGEQSQDEIEQHADIVEQLGLFSPLSEPGKEEGNGHKEALLKT